MTLHPRTLTTLLLVLLASASVFAQRIPRLEGQDQPPQTQEQDQEAQNPAATVKVNVDIVQLFFNVKDKKGGLIPNLKKDDFDVFEDGKPQAIKYFQAESNLPLTLGILLDTSPSQQRVLEMEKEVGGAFLSSILTQKDLAFLINFDEDIDLMQDFTNSTRNLKQALNKARIGGGERNNGGVVGMGGGPVPTLSSGGATKLYDAVYLAAHDELAQQVGRKAMILLTDGEDQGSKLRTRDAIEAAQKSDSICYVLLIADRGFYGFGGYSGEGEMRKLASETGGRVIDVGNKYDKLKDAFDQIARELRSQYNMGYVPTNNAKDGSFRKVEIRPKNKDYKIQARSGYYAVAH